MTRHRFAHTPPQSTSVSRPSLRLLLQLTQILPVHAPLMQSRFTEHFFASAQAAHAEPPQSMSVSSPSRCVFVHEKHFFVTLWHCPLAQSVLFTHVQRFGSAKQVAHNLPSEAHSTPPPSVHVSKPPFFPSAHVTLGEGFTHLLVAESQLPDAQSPLDLHTLPFEHFRVHAPPQSVSVSVPSRF